MTKNGSSYAWQETTQTCYDAEEVKGITTTETTETVKHQTDYTGTMGNFTHKIITVKCQYCGSTLGTIKTGCTWLGVSTPSGTQGGDCEYKSHISPDSFSCSNTHYYCSTHHMNLSLQVHDYDCYYCPEHSVYTTSRSQTSHDYPHNYYTCSTHNWTGSTSTHTYCRTHGKYSIHFPN